ncbi:hypothetical protein ACQP2P_31000 [Dactylosporangium sp. CA-139114]
MSGRSYMLAARIPMSREAFEAWLDEPAPGAEGRQRLPRPAPRR